MISIPKPSAQCYSLIRISEGFRAAPYDDGEGNQTIGYGHKITASDQITATTRWTEAEAEMRMQADALAAWSQMTSLVKIELSQGPVDALTDWTFNLGATRLRNSTMLKELNDGANDDEVIAQLEEWDHEGTTVVEGLKTRREREAKLYLTGSWQ